MHDVYVIFLALGSILTTLSVLTVQKQLSCALTHANVIPLSLNNIILANVKFFITIYQYLIKSYKLLMYVQEGVTRFI